MEDIVSIPTRHGVVRGKLRRQGQGQLLSLLIHGFASYHDWTLFKDLASCLNCSSFRFDMPGVNISEGEYTVGLNQNVEVCEDVMLYFHDKGYNVYSGLGHSKGASVLLGAIAGLSSKVIDLKKVVLLSPTFTYRPMLPGHYTKEQMDSLRTKGFFEFSPIGVPGKPIMVTRQGLEERRLYNNNKVCDIVKERDTDILIIRGNEDEVSTIDSVCQFMSKLSCLIFFLILKHTNKRFKG